jgi:hypothetical protein
LLVVEFWRFSGSCSLAQNIDTGVPSIILDAATTLEEVFICFWRQVDRAGSPRIANKGECDEFPVRISQKKTMLMCAFVLCQH